MKHKRSWIHQALVVLGLSALSATAHAAPPPAPAPESLASTSDTGLEGTLNINTANEKQWALLPGIGPSTAKKLVSYRSKHPFKEVLHVMRVKGIGRKTYNRIKPYLSLKGSTSLRKVGAKKN